MNLPVELPVSCPEVDAGFQVDLLERCTGCQNCDRHVSHGVSTGTRMDPTDFPRRALGYLMLNTLTDTYRGLVEATAQLEVDAPRRSQLDAIIARGEFRPSEDESIGFWFARFLTTRESLWDLIDEVLVVLDRPAISIESRNELRYFLIGYATLCMLIRIDRIMLFGVAYHSLVQRKLNQPFPEYAIPRKQYTRIFAAFVDQRNVVAIRDAMKFAGKNRHKLQMLDTDKDVGFIAQQLDELESALNPSRRSYIKRAWEYVSHKWRRRGVVGAKALLTGVLEGFGRTASEFFEAENKRVTEDVLDSIAEFLQPGDVIITRHAKALTNLFLPGFWPHAALYIGTPEQREAASIKASWSKEQLWAGDICVLEARKDGVRLRPLRDTLAVDIFVVLRPTVGPESIRKAIERALLHEGKMYNFDFDFFNSDRIVCTEVIYRAYDGLEGLEIPLTERGGRKTLSAEDLLDFALRTGSFTPAAIFGVMDCKDTIAYGEGVRDLLAASYRSAS